VKTKLVHDGSFFFINDVRSVLIAPSDGIRRSSAVCKVNFKQGESMTVAFNTAEACSKWVEELRLEVERELS